MLLSPIFDLRPTTWLEEKYTIFPNKNIPTPRIWFHVQIPKRKGIQRLATLLTSLFVPTNCSSLGLIAKVAHKPLELIWNRKSVSFLFFLRAGFLHEMTCVLYGWAWKQLPCTATPQKTCCGKRKIPLGLDSSKSGSLNKRVQSGGRQGWLRATREIRKKHSLEPNHEFFLSPFQKFQV